MFTRLLPAGVVGLLITAAGFASVQACSTFEEENAPTDAADEIPQGVDVASPDAGVDGDADVESFCAAHTDASFCADFESDPVALRWQEVLVEGQVEAVTPGASGSPRAAESSMADASGPPPDAGLVGDGDGGTVSVQYAVLVHPFKAATPKGVMVAEADIRVDELPPIGSALMINAFGVDDVVDGGVSQRAVQVTFNLGATVGVVEAQFAASMPGGGFSRTLEVKLPHEWFHLAIIVDRANSMVRVAIDGKEQVSEMSPVFAGVTDFHLNAGIVTTRSTERTSIGYDNVLLTAP